MQRALTMTAMMTPFLAKRKRAREARKTNSRKTIEGRSRARREGRTKQPSRVRKRKKKDQLLQRPLARVQLRKTTIKKRRRKLRQSRMMSKKQAKDQVLQ